MNAVQNFRMNHKLLISIVGPTAIGKTTLSIKLAQYFNTSIISCDSRQFYKEMQIGTAAPTTDELNAVKHYFIHNKSITNNYTVGQFELEAIDTLNQLFLNNDIVIMVGGSGLYANAVIEGLDEFPDIKEEVRKSLNLELKNNGLKSLQEKLKLLDPKSYKTIALDNPHRVIRALEVCLGTGLPYSSFLNKAKKERNFNVITIGLEAERALIYKRINLRVDQMIEEGLLNEVQKLYPFKKLNALNTVGYKEIFKYYEGEWTLNYAISEIKKNTRRFAKRQLTWFRKNKKTLWFEYNTPIEEIIKVIENKKTPG